MADMNDLMRENVLQQWRYLIDRLAELAMLLVKDAAALKNNLDHLESLRPQILDLFHRRSPN